MGCSPSGTRKVFSTERVFDDSDFFVTSHEMASRSRELGSPHVRRARSTGALLAGTTEPCDRRPAFSLSSGRRPLFAYCARAHPPGSVIRSFSRIYIPSLRAAPLGDTCTAGHTTCSIARGLAAHAECYSLPYYHTSDTLKEALNTSPPSRVAPIYGSRRHTLPYMEGCPRGSTLHRTRALPRRRAYLSSWL